MPMFQKKPTATVEAVRYNASSAESILAILKWINSGKAEHNPHAWVNDSYTLFIEGLNDTVRAEEGDWIVQGVMGEFYPLDNETFTATYEPVQ